MKLTFSTDIQAADAERRIIAGKIMEFGAIGHTSVGPVMFERGSIEIPTAAKVKLLAQHEPNNPIGRAQSFSTEGDFMFGQFKISNSSKGTDYLTLAAEDLVSGLSVGVDVISSLPKDNYLLVTAARLIEVSLVESPAFENATVTKVAASESEAEQETTQPTETESEAVVDNTAAVTPEVETAPVVEASRPTVSASFHTEVRSPIKTAGSYLEHSIKAKMGNHDSQTFVRAADMQAQKLYAANDSFTTNPAFKPVQYISSVIDTSVMTRPTIDALGGARALSASGMTISHPKITTSATLGVIAEGAATAGTQIVSSYVDATVVKIAGTQIMSQELLDRSDPSFYAAMYENCMRAYAKASDAAVIAEIVSGGTVAATSQAATIAGIQAFVAQAAPAVYAAAGETATAFIAGTSVWSLLIGSLDSTGRSLFNAASPMNSSGQSSPRGLRGDVMGLDLWVDANMVATTIDDCAFITTPSAIAIYESPMLSLQTNITATGEIAIELYAYFATKTLVAGGLQKFDKT